jgi:hypothetical protein
LERKLTAILCADVFGYSRLMGENEEGCIFFLLTAVNLTRESPSVTRRCPSQNDERGLA